MRFLHTSDWHLGRIFHGIHLTDDQAFLLNQFIDLIRDSKPQAVVIAGDIYDRAVPPTEAVELLNETLSRIILDCQTPVILIAGNHDSPERIGFGNKLLAREGLYVFGPLTGKPRTIVLEDEYGPVHFVPLTYAEPSIVRERLQEPEALDHEHALNIMINHALSQIPPSARKVAIAHAFLSGGSVTDSERPLSVGGSGMVSADLFKPFNYTALGHLHHSQKVGNDSIRYPGSLFKYSFSEANQTKGINLVELDAQGQARIENIPLKPQRDVRILEGYFKEILEHADSFGNRGDYLQIVLKDTDPILDPIGQLRSVFPNVLAIERPNITNKGNLLGLKADHRKLTEKALFASFFEQMTGQTINSEQERELTDVLEETFRELREVTI